MPRRGENIYKRKDGRWEGRYIFNKGSGKAHYRSVYGKTYSEVKDKMQLREEDCVKLSCKTDCTVFETVAMEWLKEQKPRLKDTTLDKYTHFINSYFLPEFADRNIDSISCEEVNAYIKLLLSGSSERKSLSAGTVSAALSVLKRIFVFASKMGIDAPSNFDKIEAVKCTKPMRVFSITEQKKLTYYLENNMNLSNLGIMLCLFTGIRVGELCALKWEDIDFSENCIHINKTMKRVKNKDDGTHIVISEPKTFCSIRTIPLPEHLYAILKRHKAAGSAYILTGEQTRYVEPRTMQNRFKAALKKSGIADANFHTTRHTFATRCIELGFDVKSLSEILGHANVNITLNRYVHPSMEQKQKNMNLLSALFTVK